MTAQRIGTLVFAVLLIIVGLVWVKRTEAQSPALAVTGVSSTITPGALLAGACAVPTTVSVPGARSGMTVVVTPTSDVGASAIWNSWISANDTVSVRICGLLAVTPTATTFSVRVIP